MRVLLPKRYLKGIIAFLLFLIGTVALVGAALPASYQQQLGLSATGSIFADLFHTKVTNPFVVTATVTTDKTDYPIGGTVIIGGSGWTPGETVTLQVTDNLSATDPNQVAHAPWDVVADSNGNISSTWVVDEDANALTLTLTAVGHTSGSQAQASFTDANPSATLDQCANGQAPSPNTDGCDVNSSDWVSGNVNGAKANYFEGDFLPYRMIFQNLSSGAGNSHTVTIEWDTTKGGKHALDYIGTFNQTVANANPCLGIPVGNGDPACGAPTTFPIPADPQVTGAVPPVSQIPGVFTLYGGTITSVQAPSNVGSTVCDSTNTLPSINPKYCYSTGEGFVGDKSAAIQITFTATQSNPVLAWAGHISTRKDWGFQNSAIAVSGSPYHTRLIDLDGSGGNQDRALSADAVFFPVQVTIIKETNPDDAPSKQFDYTTTGADLSNFSLTPPNGTTPVQKSFTLNSTGTRTVTESDPHLTFPKFNYTSLTCVEVDGGLGTGGFTVTDATRSVSFAPKEGQTITCTYVNTEDKKANDGRIIVDKVTNPSADPTLFTFTSDFSGTFKLADQSTPLDSGLILPVNPSSADGSYSVSEGAVADWSLTTKTCVSDSGFSAQDPSKIILHAGETITCTFTNTHLTAGLSVTKTPSVTDICNGSNTSVKYTYVVKNTGTADLTGVNLVDDNGTPANPADDIDVDGGAGFSLAAGASQTFTNTRSLNGTVTNKVTATGTTAGGQTASANASATVTGHVCTISITKTPSTTDVCNGSTVSYTIQVTNNSDKFNWTGSVVDDVLGTLSASTTLAPGGSKTFTPSGSITGTVKNTATADGKFDDPATAAAKASASATVTGHVCTISITKTPSVTDVCNGSTVSYTIKVTNNSDKFSWTGSVIDDILGSLSASTTLAPGGSATFTPSGSVTGTVKNTATADGKFDDGSATSAKASASATVTGHVCTISITKTPSTTDVCNGSTVSYTIKITNNSDKFSWTGSVVDDILGTLSASTTLAAGGSATFTPSGTISGTVKNTVTGDGKFNDGSTTAAKASASATVTGHVCTISITKTPSTTDVCNGSTVSYTIKITNNSDKFNWTGSVVDDILGTLSASTTLGPGGSSTFTPSGTISGTVKNTVTGDGKFDDGSATAAKASASATVTGHTCSISITKTPSTTDVCNGSTVSYTIKVTNNSDKFNWTGSVVDDILGSLSASTTLAAGGSATFTPSGTISGTVKNTVTADGKFDDGSATAAKASASATVTGHVCTISITKTPSTTAVCNGATVSYTIKVTNNSDKFSWTGSVIDDVLGTLSSSLTLAAGASQGFTPSGVIAGTVKNTVTADGKFSDGSSTAAKASASATVNGYTCRIKVVKITNPSGDPAGFNFAGDLSGTLHDTESVFKDVLATGTYKTSETVPSGWDLTKISCDSADGSGSGSTATYNVALGDFITCTFTNTKRGKAKVIKTFNGSSTDFGGNTFTFQLRSGASAVSAGTILESGTASAGSNTISFSTQLVPGQTYQLCEQMLPGFMTTLGPPLYSVFNPSGDNSIVCTDFTVDPGQTKSFSIDNQPPPGGMALTIGFWKNWASCSKSNGGQKPVLDKTLLAAANAGHPITEGLLVLDPNVLGASTACQDAVNLLNKTPINGGKKSASDPIFNMVAQLVAADLNGAAGAGVSVSAMAAINCAHKLLNDIAFNGNTYNKLTAAQLAAANCLATALDQYNNNKTVQACTCP